MSPEVALVFDAYPAKERSRLTALRALIYQTAAETEGVGAIEETLKWGEPSYLTTESKSGTTIRIGCSAKEPGYYFFYVHCQTTLVSQYRDWFSDVLTFEGTRAIAFAVGDALPEAVMKQCIAAALTYHR